MPSPRTEGKPSETGKGKMMPGFQEGDEEEEDE